MDAHARTLLIEGLAELRIEADAVAVDRLCSLADLVVEWNERFNLTAITEPVAMVRKHLLDSLTVHPYLNGPRVVDVGTGAGFPGLPLAILNPDKEFQLVDSIRKKIGFVTHAAGVLGLTNVEPLCSRAEALKPTERAQTVVSRALSSVGEFVRNTGHLAAGNGRLLAMKGRDPSAECTDLPKPWRVVRVERLYVPGLVDERHLVVIERPPL
jgi:16S rRNA (guanine527-N7)-methyltransferase